MDATRQSITVAIPWTDKSELRRSEKLAALADLRLTGAQPRPSADRRTNKDAPALTLQFEVGTDPALVAAAVADATNILVLTDVELCFWPPNVASSHEAQYALRLLWPCSRRRALINAIRVMRNHASAFADSAESVLLNGAMKLLQGDLDALCEPVVDLARLTAADEDGLAHPMLHAHPQARARNLSGCGKGLVAVGAIKAGEEVLRIPEHALVNIFSALRCTSFRSLARWLFNESVHHDAIVVLFTVAEYRRCKAGEYGAEPPPWADLLLTAPSIEETGLLTTWPAEGVQALGAEQVEEVVDGAFASVWELCRELSQVLRRLPKELAVSLRGPVGFDDLFWARCLFDSRAVAVEMSAPQEFRVEAAPDGISPPRPPSACSQWLFVKEGGEAAWIECPNRVNSLAPGIDLMNHSAYGSCASPTFDQSLRALVVATVAAIPAGAEICLSYGALQNWELLMYYGFCADDNPHDRLTLSLSTDDVEDGAAKQVVMTIHNIPTEHMLRMVRSPSPSTTADTPSGWCMLGVLPPQLLRCLRVLLAENASEVDPSAAPGSQESNLELDLSCLDAMEDLLQGLSAPFENPNHGSERPLWWAACGHAIEVFHASQRELVESNIAALRSCRELLRKQLSVVAPE